MILIGLGGNLPTRFGTPPDTLRAAIAAIDADAAISVTQCSRLFSSPAWPPSDQPDFANAVISVDSNLAPAELLDRLIAIETQFGRRRQVRNEARPLDLDLLAYHDLIRHGSGAPILPHPRLHERAFVLRPMADIVPGWVHPHLGRDLPALIRDLDDSTEATAIDDTVLIAR